MKNYFKKSGKNTKAKFITKVKQEILERDKVCIISGDPIEEFHHCLYGPDSNYGPDRNNTNQGVGLSSKIHYIIHHGTDGKGQEYRKKCKDYLINLKGKI